MNEYRQEEGALKHDLFLKDLQRILDYLYSTKYTGLRDIHLHMVDPTKKTNQKSIGQTGEDISFCLT